MCGGKLKIFEEKYGYKVEVFSAGTGKAIANAKSGNADVILVHAKASEEEFVKDGYARVVDGFKSERLTFMYNYFVLVGPKADPAKVKEAADVKAAMKAIADTKSKFISRGDESGTHKAELKLCLGGEHSPVCFNLCALRCNSSGGSKDLFLFPEGFGIFF